MTEEHPQAIIVTEDLQRHYEMGGEVIHALRGIDLQIAHGEYVAMLSRTGRRRQLERRQLGGTRRISAGV